MADYELDVSDGNEEMTIGQVMMDYLQYICGNAVRTLHMNLGCLPLLPYQGKESMQFRSDYLFLPRAPQT